MVFLTFGSFTIALPAVRAVANATSAVNWALNAAPAAANTTGAAGPAAKLPTATAPIMA